MVAWVVHEHPKYYELDPKYYEIDPKYYEPEVVQQFRTVGEVVDTGLALAASEEARTIMENKLYGKGASQLQLIPAIHDYLIKSRRTFLDISRSSQGPYHLGWSRLASEMKQDRNLSDDALV